MLRTVLKCAATLFVMLLPVLGTAQEAAIAPQSEDNVVEITLR